MQRRCKQVFKDLHPQVLEQMLQGEMDAHLGYKKNDVSENNTGNSNRTWRINIDKEA